MLIEIDHERCCRDLKCVDECPVTLFSYNKNEKKIVVQNDIDTCIKCGHCTAVCPKEAISLSFFDKTSFIENDKDYLLTFENIDYILRSRRSIRSYKKDLVDKKKIKCLIESASSAPTGHNSRCVNWLVIYHKEKVEKCTRMVLDWMNYVDKEDPATSQLLNLRKIIDGYELGYDGILRGAPHLVIAYASKFAPTAAIDCASAAAYLELAAPGLGLGTCWAGFFNIAASMWPPLKKELNIPKDNKNFASVMIGLPKHKYSQVIKREPGTISFI